MELSKAMDTEDGMVVKRLSVPSGLEELMESLTKEVLMWQPKDVCTFASDYFARLLLLRDQGHYKEKKAKKTIALSRPMARDILKDIKISESADAYKRPNRMLSKQLSMDVGNDQIPPSAKGPFIPKMRKSVSVQNPNENLSKAERRRIIRRKTPNKEILLKKEQESRESSSVRKASIVSTPASGNSVKGGGATKKSPKVATVSPKKKDSKEKENKDNETQKKPPISGPDKKPLRKTSSQASLTTPRSKKSGILSKDIIPKSLPIPIPVPIQVPSLTRSRKGKIIDVNKSKEDVKVEEKSDESKKASEESKEDTRMETLGEKEIGESSDIINNKPTVETVADDDAAVTEPLNLESEVTENLKDSVDKTVPDAIVTVEAANSNEESDKNLNEVTDICESIVVEAASVESEITNENVPVDQKIEGELDDLELKVYEQIENAMTEIAEDTSTVKSNISALKESNEENVEEYGQLENSDAKSIESKVNILYDSSKLHEELVSDDKAADDEKDEATHDSVNNSKDTEPLTSTNVYYDSKNLYKELENTTSEIEEVEEGVVNEIEAQIAETAERTESKVSYNADKLHEELSSGTKDLEESVLITEVKDTIDNEEDSLSSLNYDPEKLHEELTKENIEEPNRNMQVASNQVKENALLENEDIDTSEKIASEESVSNISYSASKLHEELDKSITDDVEEPSMVQGVEESVISSENTDLSDKDKSDNIDAYDSNKLHDELNKDSQEDKAEQVSVAQNENDLENDGSSKSDRKINGDPTKLQEEINKVVKYVEEDKNASLELKTENETDKNKDSDELLDSTKMPEELSSSLEDNKNVDENSNNDEQIIVNEEITRAITSGSKKGSENLSNEHISDSVQDKSTDENIPQEENAELIKESDKQSTDSIKLHEELHKPIDETEYDTKAQDLSGHITTETSEKVRAESKASYNSAKLHEELHSTSNENGDNEKIEDRSASSISYDPSKLHEEIHTDSKEDAEKENETKENGHSNKEMVSEEGKDDNSLKYDANKLHEEINEDGRPNSQLDENADKEVFGSEVSYDPTKLHDELNSVMLGSVIDEEELSKAVSPEQESDEGESKSNALNESKTLTEKISDDTKEVNFNEDDINLTGKRSKRSISNDPNDFHDALHKDISETNNVQDNNVNIEEVDSIGKNGITGSVTDFDSNKLHDELYTDLKETEDTNKEENVIDNVDNNDTEESNSSFDPNKLHEELHSSAKIDDTEIIEKDESTDATRNTGDAEDKSQSSAKYDPDKLHAELEKDLTEDNEKESEAENISVGEMSNASVENRSESNISYDPIKLHEELSKDSEKGTGEETLKNDPKEDVSKDIESNSNIICDPSELHEELSKDSESDKELETTVEEDFKDEISADSISNSKICYDPIKLHEELEKSTEVDKLEKYTNDEPEDPRPYSISYDPTKLHEQLDKDRGNEKNSIASEISSSVDFKILHDELNKNVSDETAAENDEIVEFHESLESKLSDSGSTFGANKLSQELQDSLTEKEENETGQINDTNIIKRSESNMSYDPNNLHEELIGEQRDEPKSINDNAKHDNSDKDESSLVDVAKYDSYKLHQELVKEVETMENKPEDVMQNRGLSEDSKKENIEKQSCEKISHLSSAGKRSESSISYDSNKLHQQETNDQAGEVDENTDSGETTLKKDDQVSRSESKLSCYDPNKLHEELHKAAEDDTETNSGNKLHENPEDTNVNKINLADNEQLQKNLSDEKTESTANFDLIKLHEELNKESSEVESESNENANINTADEKITTEDIMNDIKSFDVNELQDELHKESQKEKSEIENEKEKIVAEDNVSCKTDIFEEISSKKIEEDADDENELNITAEKPDGNHNVSFEPNKLHEELHSTSKEDEIGDKDEIEGENRTILDADSSKLKPEEDITYDSQTLHAELNETLTEGKKELDSNDNKEDDLKPREENEKSSEKRTFDLEKLHEELLKPSGEIEETEIIIEPVSEEIVKKDVAELRAESTLSFNPSKLHEEIENIPEDKASGDEKKTISDELITQENNVETADEITSIGGKKTDIVDINFDSNKLHEELVDQKIEEENETNQFKDGNNEDSQGAEEQNTNKEVTDECEKEDNTSAKSFDLNALHAEIHKVNDDEEGKDKQCEVDDKDINAEQYKSCEDTDIYLNKESELKEESSEDVESTNEKPDQNKSCEDSDLNLNKESELNEECIKSSENERPDSGKADSKDESKLNEEDKFEKNIENISEDSADLKSNTNATKKEIGEKSQSLDDNKENKSGIEKSEEGDGTVSNDSNETSANVNNDAEEVETNETSEDGHSDDKKGDEIVEEGCKVNIVYITGEPTDGDLETKSKGNELYDSQKLHEEINAAGSIEILAPKEIVEVFSAKKLTSQFSEMSSKSWSNDSNDVVVEEKISPSESPLVEHAEDVEEKETKEETHDDGNGVVQITEVTHNNDSEVSPEIAERDEIDNQENNARINKDMLDDGFGDSVATDDENTKRIKREAAFIVTEEPIFLVQDNEAKINNISRVCHSIEEVEEGALFRAASTIQAVIRGFLTRRKKRKQEKVKLKELQQPAVHDEQLEHRLGVLDTLNQAATTIQAGARGYLVRKHLGNPTVGGQSVKSDIEDKKLESKSTIQPKDAPIEIPSIITADTANITRGFLIRRNFTDDVISRVDRPDDVTYKIMSGADGPKIVEISNENQTISPDTTGNAVGISDKQIIEAMEKLNSPPDSPNNVPSSFDPAALHKGIYEGAKDADEEIVLDTVKGNKLQKQLNTEQEEISESGQDKRQAFKRSERDLHEAIENEKGTEVKVASSYDPNKLREELDASVAEINEVPEMCSKQLKNAENIESEINVAYEANKLHEEISRNSDDRLQDEEKSDLVNNVMYGPHLENHSDVDADNVNSAESISKIETFDPDKLHQELNNLNDTDAEEKHVKFVDANSVSELANCDLSEESVRTSDEKRTNLLDKASAVVDAVIKTASDVTDSFDNVSTAHNAIFVNGHYDNSIRPLSENFVSNAPDATVLSVQSSEGKQIDVDNGNKIKTDELETCDPTAGKVTELEKSDHKNVDEKRSLQGNEIPSIAKLEPLGELEDNEKKMQIESVDKIAEPSDNKLPTEPTISACENEESKLDLAKNSHAIMKTIEDDNKIHDESGVTENALYNSECTTANRPDCNLYASEMDSCKNLLPQISVTDDSSAAVKDDIDPDAKAICASESAVFDVNCKEQTEKFPSESREIDLAENGNGQEHNNAIVDASKSAEVTDTCDSLNDIENRNMGDDKSVSGDDNNMESLEIDMIFKEKSRSSIDSLTSNDSVVTVKHNLVKAPDSPNLQKAVTPDIYVNKSPESFSIPEADSIISAAGNEEENTLEQIVNTDINKSQLEKKNSLTEDLKEIDEVTLTHVIESEWTPESAKRNTLDIDTVIEKEIIRKDTYGARENLAAVAIQSGWRGYQVRHDLKMKALKKKDESLVFDLELSDDAEDAQESDENASPVNVAFGDEASLLLTAPEGSYATSADDVRHRESTSSDPKIDRNENNAKINTNTASTPTNSYNLVEKVITKSAQIIAKFESGTDSKSEEEFGNTFSIDDSSSESGADLKATTVFPEDGIPTTPRDNHPGDNAGNSKGTVLNTDVISMATVSSAKVLAENKAKKSRSPKLKKQPEVIVIPLGDKQDSLTDSDVMDLATSMSAGATTFPMKKRSANARKDGGVAKEKPALSRQQGLIHSGEGHDLVVPEVAASEEAVIPESPETTSPQGLQHSGELHDLMPLANQLQAESPGAEVLTLPSEGTHALVGVPALLVDDAHHSSMEAGGNRKNSTIKPEDMEEKAATKIQAGFRGYQVRKQMKQSKNNSDSTNSRILGKRRGSNRRPNEVTTKSSIKSATDLEEKSATKIQAGIRGFLVRKRQKNTKKTTTQSS